MSATSAWTALHVLHSMYPKNERSQTRLTLAPNRCSLGVLWTYSGLVVVLSWDLTHKNTQTSTQAHACRLTLTLARSTRTHVVRPVRVSKHTLLHWHKSDKNIPVNLVKTVTAAFPFLYSFKNVQSKSTWVQLSTPPCQAIRQTKPEKGITCSVKAARTARAKRSCLGLTNHRCWCRQNNRSACTLDSPIHTDWICHFCCKCWHHSLDLIWPPLCDSDDIL